MFYQKRVAEKLGDEYNVFGPSENCRFAAYTHNTLRHWLPTFPKPDIIHWNNGLWDIGHFYGEKECGTSIPVYLEYLERIAKILLSTGAKVIFATTTPCHPKREIGAEGMLSTHRNAEIEQYNKAAVELMNRLGIEVNDLHPLLDADPDRYISSDLIHPSPEGVEILSDAVCEKIRAAGVVEGGQSSSAAVDFEEEYKTMDKIDTADK